MTLYTRWNQGAENIDMRTYTWPPPRARVEAFRLAHRDAGQNKPLYLGHPQLEGFEVLQTVRRGKDAAA